ncbi:MAG TPA: hypothetical protein VMN78_08280, partial [Longimicrobiales bacterium]|nr:hypothetical protein [Longimicrobiales bacterium]
MSPVTFDALTRALGGAQSRREAIRIMGGTLASAAFGTFTVACGDDPTDPPPENQDECEVPSACGARSFCDDDETCICVNSAEDVLRCAQLPSSCSLEPCTTSADCAHLGENWFCDSPGSGCCSDTDQYCLAPCGTSYEPPEEPEPGEGTGYQIASANNSDILFFNSIDEFTTTYYHGYRHTDGSLEVVYLTHEDFW